jgi:hypothetical protein
MASLLGSLGASSGKIMDAKSGGESWHRAPVPVSELFWRVRHCAVSFGYDLKSYSQNFDDGPVTAQRM